MCLFSSTTINQYASKDLSLKRLDMLYTDVYCYKEQGAAKPSVQNIMTFSYSF